MKVLIIEDEFYAAKRLIKLLLDINPHIEILDTLDSVEDAISWLSNNEEPDLVFADIQLADGLSFQIFEHVKISAPLIFTTAFDEYALKAFKVNSLDYLLKPIELPLLKKALDQFEHYKENHAGEVVDWENLLSDMISKGKKYKERFLIRLGDAYAYLKVENIRLLYSEDGITFAIDKENKRNILDHSLDHIQDYLDPDHFFRISRKYIVNIQFINKIHPYLNQRLKLELTQPAFKADLIVSREKVKTFKDWLGR